MSKDEGLLQCRVVHGPKRFPYKTYMLSARSPTDCKILGSQWHIKKGIQVCVHMYMRMFTGTPTVPWWGQKKWVIVAGTGEWDLRGKGNLLFIVCLGTRLDFFFTLAISIYHLLKKNKRESFINLSVTNNKLAKCINQALQKIWGETGGNVEVMAGSALNQTSSWFWQLSRQKVRVKSSFQHDLHIKSSLGASFQKRFYFKHMQNTPVWWPHRTHCPTSTVNNSGPTNSPPHPPFDIEANPRNHII